MKLELSVMKKYSKPAVWWATTGAIMADGRFFCIEKMLPSRCLSLPRNAMPCEAMQIADAAPQDVMEDATWSHNSSTTLDTRQRGHFHPCQAGRGAQAFTLGQLSVTELCI
jgi:hypothetical protein